VLSWFEHKEIQYLGFSISENFQMRNTHKTIAESLLTLTEILRLQIITNKEVVAYPLDGLEIHGDPWNVDIVGEWTEKVSNMGVKILSLSGYCRKLNTRRD
jgi:hydroxymethylglutaryl-CoA lyase